MKYFHLKSIVNQIVKKKMIMSKKTNTYLHFYLFPLVFFFFVIFVSVNSKKFHKDYMIRKAFLSLKKTQFLIIKFPSSCVFDFFFYL